MKDKCYSVLWVCFCESASLTTSQGGLSTAGGSVTLGLIADLYEPEDQQWPLAFIVLSSCIGTSIGGVIGGPIEYCKLYSGNLKEHRSPGRSLADKKILSLKTFPGIGTSTYSSSLVLPFNSCTFLCPSVDRLSLWTGKQSDAARKGSRKSTVPTSSRSHESLSKKLVESGSVPLRCLYGNPSSFASRCCQAFQTPLFSSFWRDSAPSTISGASTSSPRHGLSSRSTWPTFSHISPISLGYGRMSELVRSRVRTVICLRDG